MLSEKYQGEQKGMDTKIRQLHEAMEAITQTAINAEKWVELMKKYVNPTELNALIEKSLCMKRLRVRTEAGSKK